MMGKQSGFIEMWDLCSFAAPFHDERAFCEVNSAEKRADCPAFHFVLKENNSDRKFALNGLESSPNYTQDTITTPCLGRLTLFQHVFINFSILRK